MVGFGRCLVCVGPPMATCFHSRLLSGPHSWIALKHPTSKVFCVAASPIDRWPHPRSPNLLKRSTSNGQHHLAEPLLNGSAELCEHAPAERQTIAMLNSAFLPACHLRKLADFADCAPRRNGDATRQAVESVYCDGQGTIV